MTSDIVMTRPSAFEVDYVINPWMRPDQWRRGQTHLHRQAAVAWHTLHDSLRAHQVRTRLIDAVAGLPDLVFSANAAVVLDGRVLLGHFAHLQRRREEPHYRRFFAELARAGVVNQVAGLPGGIVQEGAGDCLWDPVRQLFWMGYGQRSTLAAVDAIAAFFDVPVVALELVDPRFYHLDVALAVLERGEVLYYPAAFSPQSLALIHQRVDESQRIPVAQAEAVRFNLNVISLNGCLFMTPPTSSLRNRLGALGYRLCEIDLSPFLLAGGAAACLTLRLDYRRGVVQHTGQEVSHG